jgi:hypothetical protein
MSGTTSIPLTMTMAGPVATPPATLQQALISNVALSNPGYTANLPGSLIEDISSTDVGALITMDQARVDAINNVTPYGANPYVLAQLGQQFGIPQGTPANASVYVVISGPAGYVIPPGFVVSDGTNQYVIQDGGVVSTTGTTQQLYAVASQSGSFAIPASTVTTIVTSVPTGYTLTVTNPQAGTPSTAAESIQSYQSRVLLAGQVAATGTPSYLKTLLYALPGISQRLVAVRLIAGAGYEVIAGGGDAYQVANAIYNSGVDISTLQSSSTTSRNVSATIYDAPDSYNITFVNPPQQVVTVAITWNTQQANFTAASAVNQAGSLAVLSYVNSIPVGQPINLLEMQASFQAGVASILPSNNLTTLTFVVTINGTVSTPSAGTSTIASDPESYFFASANGVTSTQG